VARDLEILTPGGTPAEEGLHLVAGDTVVLRATATTQEGDSIPDPNVLWTSGDTSRARIDANGRLIALAAGPLTVTARVDEADEQLVVTIEDPPEVAAEPPPDTEVDRARTTDPGPAPPDSTPSGIEEEPVPTPAPDGMLRLRIMPGADRLEIAGVVVRDTADVRSLSVPLPEGEYRLHIETEGRVPVDSTFLITSNDTTDLGTIRMERRG
jgi:hypothetical protein